MAAPKNDDTRVMLAIFAICFMTLGAVIVTLVFEAMKFVALFKYIFS